MITRQLNLKTLNRILKQRSESFQKFHSSKHEHHLFDQNPHPIASSVDHCMLNCLHRNLPCQAFRIFKSQLQMGLGENIDEVTVALAIKACQRDTQLGCQIHGFAISSGFISFVTVPNSLMNMYSKAGHFERALCIFESLCCPDIVSWNTILSGCRKSEDALTFALCMNYNGVVFDPVTYSTVLSCCYDHDTFPFGMQLHSNVFKFGLDCDVFVGNALITLYSRWGCLLQARRVFYEMPQRDLVSWNALLSGYTQEGDHGLEAILVFVEMVKEGMQLDHVSFTSAVSACGYEKNLELVRQIHSLTVKSGYVTHASVCNVLISTYFKCEVVEAAKLVFQLMPERNVVSWTTRISMEEEDVMSLFNDMRLEGVYPNDVTFVGLIHAITIKNLVEEGQIIHGLCIKTGFLSEPNVLNSFITMYAKFKSMQDSVKVFEELNCKEIISWNALISGFAQNGLCQKALQIFLSAITECQPNHYTFGSVLSAIADAEDISLKYGQLCHSYLIKLGLNTNPIMSGALLDMYAKRGSIYESQRVFYEMPKLNRSQHAWTAIISAYAVHGDYESVIEVFREMEIERVRPDSITFLSVLTACSRKGMVEMGRCLFNSMVNNYGIEPSPEQYSCMVDLLGRSGQLEEAEEMMGRIPGKPGLSVLQSLLGACKIYGNVEMGERVIKALMELEPMESGSYVLMSNLYAEKGEWEKVAKIRRGMRDRGVKKEVGFSWVDVGESLCLHGFSSGDKSHPQSEEICRMAKFIGIEMKSLRPKERIFA